MLLHPAQAVMIDSHHQAYLATGAKMGLSTGFVKNGPNQNARLFVAARKEETATSAIKCIDDNAPKSSGTLQYLRLNIANLQRTQASA